MVNLIDRHGSKSMINLGIVLPKKFKGKKAIVRSLTGNIPINHCL